MRNRLSALVLGAALASFALAPAATAAVIDFEGPSLVNIYFPGDSFTQAGFRLTQFDDLGSVDVAAALDAVAPTGNATQFYTNLNDGFLEITRDDGRAFSLNGFAAAFVPQTHPATAQTLFLLALGTTTGGANPFAFFNLGDTTSGASHYPFLTFSSASNFGGLKDLVALDFFMCAVEGNSACGIATRDNAQFSLDNINVAAVPEPETVALMGAGLLALGATARRRRSR